ncbi:MAG: acyl carrier protein [Candidatus Izemoplasmatales bacterium]
MNMILSQVTELIAKEFGVDEKKLSRSTRLVEDLNIDSLDAVELMMRLEETFGFKIEDDEATRLKSVDDIVVLVENRTRKA